MHSTLLRFSFLVAFSVTSLARPVHAQDDPTPLPDPTSGSSEPAVEATTTPSTSVTGEATRELREPARLELTSGIGYTFSSGPYASAQTSFGRVVSDRVVLTAGAGFSMSFPRSGESTWSAQSWSATLGARVYTRPPSAHRFSPVIHLAISYSGRHDENQASSTYMRETTVHSLGARVTGGLAYFVTDQLGVIFEAGLAAQQAVAIHEVVRPAGSSPTSDGFSANSVVQLSFVLRR